MQIGGEIAVKQQTGRLAGDGAEAECGGAPPGPLPEEERRWVRAALAGDLAAFDALVDRHWRKVASVVGRFLTDANDVEDAVQETFVRAFESLRGFRGDASVRTWLIRIAVNLCKNRRGEFWRRRVTLTDDDAALHAEAAGARTLAEAALLQGEWERALRAAMQQLPDRQRLPLLLHFFEDLSGAEIAAVLGWNESTVWSRIYAGCRALRKKLASYREA
jgi:RNA polymerase sigma-70 factor (ECF subfamily)